MSNPLSRFVAILLLFPFVGALARGAETSAPAAAATSAAAAQKLERRNNAASLLAQLVDDEKGLHYVLILKGHRAELQQLVKNISATATSIQDQLQALAKADPTLNLRAVELPAGEIATRAAIESTKEHELLLTSGADFEFTLLLTQADALSYGWHLAQIVADNSPNAAQAKQFTTFSTAFHDLYTQTVTLMRSPPK